MQRKKSECGPFKQSKQGNMAKVMRNKAEKKYICKLGKQNRRHGEDIQGGR